VSLPHIQRLVVATRNEGKRAEIAQLLEGLGVQVLSLRDFPAAPEVDEPFATFAENAAHKATETARAIGEWCLADDSGLEVAALDGAPGVRSARVADSDPARIAWLLGQLKAVPAGQRQARFMCVAALASPEGLQGQWEGTVEGLILTAPRGEKGFGYDPVFWHEALGKTFAELSREEKSAVSHRGQALRAFRRFLEAGA
jgi:XTP/dITP diphosphohydrolase